MKINLGCGNRKIPGFVNVDSDPEMKPDVVMDCIEYLKTLEPGSVNKITLFHTLEHISKVKWEQLFCLANKSLEWGGTMLLSFPEFSICVKNYMDNVGGKRDFWEATLYGRQLSPGDYHIAICNREEIGRLLVALGFELNYCGVELEPHNSLIRVTKVRDIYTYIDEVKNAVWSK